ncbi:hypothetical protein [Congregicoccus parvus]|uniref:hypothetical protein n=1 Tax=Congregicoccus parvus TaxID=3081749 RepID=UPI003FA58212
MNRFAPKLEAPRADFGAMALGGASGGARGFDYGTRAMVPLTTNWPYLLRAARRFERVFVQSQHAHARLVFTGEMPVLAGTGAGGTEDGEDGLRFDVSFWDSAWATVHRCDCCASPGRVSFHNAMGIEFMQMCASPDCSVERWSDFVAAAARSASEDRSERRTPLPLVPFVPESARRLSATAELLVPLCNALASERVAVRVTVRTAEVAHTRQIVPHVRSVRQGLLSLADGPVASQLALRSVRALRVEDRPSGPRLLIEGEDGMLLFTIAGASDPVGAVVWRVALQEVCDV